MEKKEYYINTDYKSHKVLCNKLSVHDNGTTVFYDDQGEVVAVAGPDTVVMRKYAPSDPVRAKNNEQKFTE